MNKKIIFKIGICMCVFYTFFHSTVFGSTYDSVAMSTRNYEYDDAGNAYVKYGDPVVCDSGSGAGLTITESYQDSNGDFHYIPNYSNGEDPNIASLPSDVIVEDKGPVYAITIDENGETGNMKEFGSVTLSDQEITGSETNNLKLDCKVNAVVADGENFSNPPMEIALYGGDILNKQTAIDMINETGQMNGWLPEGESKWTIELYEEVVSELVENDPNMKSEWDYIGTILNDSTFLSKIISESIFNAVTGQLESVEAIIGNIVCIIGIGLDENGNIVPYFTDWKLCKTFGSDKDASELQTEDPDEPETPEGGTPTNPNPGGPWSDMGTASVSANVYSDKYNVSVAIPTSENVMGSISASDMSWYYNVKKEYDSQDYTIDSVTLYWDPYWIWVDDGYYYTTSTGVEVFVKTGEHQEIRYASSATESVTGTYTTHYFAVAEAHMNKLGGGSVSNDAVGTIASVGAANIGGGISRDGGIVFEESRMDKSSFSAYGETKGGAISQAQAVIRQRIKLSSKVKNDTLIIKSTVLWGITDNWGDEFKGTPYIYPSHLVSPSSEMKSGSGMKMIPSDKTNGTYASHASASYPMVPGFDGQAKYSKGATPPNVFVHTPVVNKTQITVDNFINQKVVQESGLTYLQLDKGFTIKIPDSGTHIGAQGYGSRAYNSYQAVPGSITNWGKIKDVKLPFDAYLQPSNTLIKAGKWLSDYGLATAGNTYTFLIPVWSEEAKGTIETRVVAENIASYLNGSSASTGLIQDEANLDYTKYIAEKKIPVEVIGKIYDLRISATNDPGWPGIKGEEGPYVTAAEFPFGQLNQNAMSAYKYAPKLGYLVEFDFKTKGVKTDNVDVSIQPEGFYFISKNGGDAQKVDLYFKTVTNQYVKIDPSANTSDIIVNLSNPFMKVAQSELIDSTRIMRQQVQVLYTYAQDVLIGKLPSLNIPEKLRLCYNNFAEYVSTASGPKLYGKPEAAIANDANGGLSYSTGKYDQVNNGRDTVIASVGHWYAAYRLPSSTIAVPPGTTAKQIMTNPNLIKKNGYILVKFDIVGKNGDEDYLRYTGPESIMEPGEYEDDRKWQDPDGTLDPTDQPVELPSKKPEEPPREIPDGTVIIFETDWRANNDNEVIGTH